jgi:hypothetical protein
MVCPTPPFWRLSTGLPQFLKRAVGLLSRGGLSVPLRRLARSGRRMLGSRCGDPLGRHEPRHPFVPGEAESSQDDEQAEQPYGGAFCSGRLQWPFPRRGALLGAASAPWWLSAAVQVAAGAASSIARHTRWMTWRAAPVQLRRTLGPTSRVSVRIPARGIRTRTGRCPVCLCSRPGSGCTRGRRQSESCIRSSPSRRAGHRSQGCRRRPGLPTFWS